MAIMTTGQLAKALYPGVRAWWGKDYGEHPKEYTDLFEVKKSSRNYEEDVGISGFSLAPIKAEAGPISIDDESQTYVTRYTHAVHALGFIISRELAEDDQYNIVGERRTKGLSFSIRQTMETVAANVYNRAFSSSYLFGDGKALIVSDHFTSNGAQSNVLATPADLSELAIEQMIQQMMQAKNDRGLPIPINPKSLIVHPMEAMNAHRILYSALQNDTANNATNALKGMGLIPAGVKVNHYLSDADAWFIRTDCPYGMTFFMRREPDIEMDSDTDSQNAKYLASVRFSVGNTDWRGIFGSPGA